jgi:uncharacterized protein with PQ loop repeat
MEIAALAGVVSTVLFATANLPMVVKAMRSRDLSSYSRPSLVLGNIGNLVYTIYVVSLPFGPIWVLHAFHLTSMATMLAMSLRSGSASMERPQRTQSRGGSRSKTREKRDETRSWARTIRCWEDMSGSPSVVVELGTDLICERQSGPLTPPAR